MRIYWDIDPFINRLQHLKGRSGRISTAWTRAPSIKLHRTRPAYSGLDRQRRRRRNHPGYAFFSFICLLEKWWSWALGMLRTGSRSIQNMSPRVPFRKIPLERREYAMERGVSRDEQSIVLCPLVAAQSNETNIKRSSVRLTM